MLDWIDSPSLTVRYKIRQKKNHMRRELQKLQEKGYLGRTRKLIGTTYVFEPPTPPRNGPQLKVPPAIISSVLWFCQCSRVFLSRAIFMYTCRLFPRREIPTHAY